MFYCKPMEFGIPHSCTKPTRFTCAKNAVTKAGQKWIAPHHAMALKTSMKPGGNGQKYLFYIRFQCSRPFGYTCCGECVIFEECRVRRNVAT